MRIEGWDGAIGNARWWARALSFGAVIGAIIALLGPYGSFYNELSLRLVDWVAILLLDTVILGLAVPPIIRAGAQAGMPRLATLLAALMACSVPAAMVSETVTRFFWPEHVREYRWVDWYLQTLLLAVVVTSLWAVFEIARRSWQVIPPEPEPSADREPMGADILCLQMEDNYVRVHRQDGSTLHLMPLHQAIGRYGKSNGLQVHRSWWVASHAVERAERDVRNWRLRLRNGVTVPIARNRINAVRRQGWLDRA
jgi:hypothetical protein